MDIEDRQKLQKAVKDLDKLQREVVIMREELDKNTAVTMQLDSNTKEMIDLFNTLKGGFKTLEYIGKLAKPLAWLIGLSTSAGIAWYNFKHLIAGIFRS